MLLSRDRFSKTISSGMVLGLRNAGMSTGHISVHCPVPLHTQVANIPGHVQSEEIPYSPQQYTDDRTDCCKQGNMPPIAIMYHKTAVITDQPTCYTLIVLKFILGIY